MPICALQGSYMTEISQSKIRSMTADSGGSKNGHSKSEEGGDAMFSGLFSNMSVSLDADTKNQPIATAAVDPDKLTNILEPSGTFGETDPIASPFVIEMTNPDEDPGFGSEGEGVDLDLNLVLDATDDNKQGENIPLIELDGDVLLDSDVDDFAQNLSLKDEAVLEPEIDNNDDIAIALAASAEAKTTEENIVKDEKPLTIEPNKTLTERKDIGVLRSNKEAGLTSNVARENVTLNQNLKPSVTDVPRSALPEHGDADQEVDEPIVLKRIIPMAEKKDDAAPKTRRKSDGFEVSAPKSGEGKAIQSDLIVQKTLVRVSENRLLENEMALKGADLKASIRSSGETSAQSVQRSEGLTSSTTMASVSPSGQSVQQDVSQSFKPMLASAGNANANILDLMRKDWEIRLGQRLEKGLASGEQDLELILTPKSLGKVIVNMRLNQDDVSIKMASESSLTAHVLGDAEAKLQQMFEAAGLRLSLFQSLSSGGRNDGRQQNGDKNGDKESGFGRVKRASASDSSKDLLQSAQNVHSGSVNMTA